MGLQGGFYCKSYYFVILRKNMIVKICGKCGILWSSEHSLHVSLKCPNCEYPISKDVEI